MSLVRVTSAQRFDDHESIESAATAAATACKEKLKSGVKISAAFLNCRKGHLLPLCVTKAVRAVIGEDVPLVGGGSGMDLNSTYVTIYKSGKF